MKLVFRLAVRLYPSWWRQRYGRELEALLRGDSAQTTLRLTYLDRDPAQAQRIAERLIAAIANETTARAASTEVLDAPSLPTSPIEPAYPVIVASGGGVGLAVGAVVLPFLRFRRRPADAGQKVSGHES
jgi:hypothetical protein